MDNNLNIASLFPIIITLLAVFIKRDVFLSLMLGTLCGFIILFLRDGSLLPIFQVILEVLSNTSTLKTTLFILLTSALINAINKSSGIDGLVTLMTSKTKLVKSKLSSELLVLSTGLVLFVDATSSIIVTSLIGKSFSKKYNISKDKIALIANSTGAPIAWFIPFSGAATLVASLLNDIDSLEFDGFSYVIKAIPFQLYTITLIIIVACSILFKFELGNIKNKHYTSEYKQENNNDINESRSVYMFLPIITLLLSIFTIMYITGEKNIMRGDGSSAVFYAAIITILITGIFYWVSGVSNLFEYINWCVEGSKYVYSIVGILILSFLFSKTLQHLQTANYLASFIHSVPNDFIVPAILILSAIVSLSTGTSSGAISILTPITVLVAQDVGISISLVLGAIISGAVFGDQNSPISDSVLLTSTSVGIDILTHVKSQLPYTLLSLFISLVLFFIIGIII